ncbi:hypothetical protein CVT24_008436 [Panaeolus cyanescens]|uniref:Uncharacterized protein n=1 Tax=Panaeolus cyanescens TaxID=181874 RepID=A0A409VEV4_9AGAR|nr:hypothetical protein CVT24_008436 [Panaeolus cyanescens]
MAKSKNKKGPKAVFVDDKRTKLFTISHCYPLNFNWIYPKDRKACALWLAEIIGTEPLFRMWHRPKSRAMILVEIDRAGLPESAEARLLGEHRWSEILKDPVDLEVDWKSKVFHSLYNTPDAAIKDGWNPVDIEDDWFEDWEPGMSRFHQPYPMSHWCAIVPADTTGKQICHHLPVKIKPQPPREPQPVVGSSNWIEKKVVETPTPPTPAPAPLPGVEPPKPAPIVTEMEMPTLQEASKKWKVLNGSKSPKSPLSPRSPLTPMSPVPSAGVAGGSKWGKPQGSGRPVPMSIRALHSDGPSKPSPAIKINLSSGGKSPLPTAAPRPAPQNTWAKRPNIIPDAPKPKPKVEEEDHLAKWAVNTPSSGSSAAITPAGSRLNTPITQSPAPLPSIEPVAPAASAWNKPLRANKNKNKAEPVVEEVPVAIAYHTLDDSDEEDDAGVFLMMTGAVPSHVGHEPHFPENDNTVRLWPVQPVLADMPVQEPQPPAEEPLVCPTHGVNACKKGVCKDMNKLYLQREGNKKRLREAEERKKKTAEANAKKREKEKKQEDLRRKQEEEKLRQQQAWRDAQADEDEDEEDDDDDDSKDGYKPLSFVQQALAKAKQPPRNTNVAASATKGKGREVINDPREGKLRAFEEEPQASESDESSDEFDEEDLF